ncbi:MAG: hypothetical protein WCF36_10130 [Candidatus Nanopelagicales bacterium]
MTSVSRHQHSTASNVRLTSAGWSPQSRRVLRDRPGPPPRDALLRDVGEQLGGQPDRPDPFQLRDLAQERLQTELARIGLHFGEEARVVIIAGLIGLAGLRDDATQRRRHTGRQPRLGDRAEPLVGDPVGRPDDAGHPPGRLKLLRPAPAQHRLTLTVLVQLAWAHLLCQPGDHLVLVAAGEHPEPQRFTDLPPVLLHRPAGEVVAGEVLRGQPQLPSDILNRRRWNCARVPREPRVDLEELEHQAEPHL